MAERDSRGRFGKGNMTSRLGGNPALKSLAAAQAAVRAAATPEAIADVLRALHGRALAGDVAAATAWLQRVLGRPREEPSGTSIDLGDLSTANGVAEALRSVAAAAAAGELPHAEAAGIVQTLRSIVDLDVLARLEQRLAAVEGTAP